MSDNTQHARTVTTVDRGTLDLRSLMLYAILLAAGIVLNLTVSKLFASVTGGMLAPEFVIAAFCLEILIVRPTIPQSLVVGLIAGVIIQFSASVKGPDLIAEPIAAAVMAALVLALAKSSALKVVPLVGTFVVTFVSGLIYALVLAFGIQHDISILFVMLPVVAATGVVNGVIVQALFFPLRKVLNR